MSNTPKWTPGPWRVEDLEIYGSRPGRPYILVATVPKNHVSEFAPVEPQAVPTVHLIAAAPDLYEALERIVKWMDAQGFNALYQDDTAIKDARAALAKSRGETK